MSRGRPRRTTILVSEPSSSSHEDLGNNIATILRSLAQHFNNSPTPIAPPQLTHRNEMSTVVEQFKRYRPPPFNGKKNLAEAETWLRALEKIFTHIVCTDEQKISCVIFQLTDEVDYWWEAYCRTRTITQRGTLTWEEFKEAVIQNYMPQSFQDQKETEFIQLKQGSMTVLEYEQKFSQLSRYAPHLVNTEIKKAQRFEKNLRPEISSILAKQGMLTYAGAFSKAQEIASRLKLENLEKKIMEFPNKRKFENPNQRREYNKHVFKEENIRQAPQRTRPTCPKCRRNHNGQCLYGSRLCYHYKESGHGLSSCPLLKNKGKSKMGPAHVFEMTQQEAADESAPW